MTYSTPKPAGMRALVAVLTLLAVSPVMAQGVTFTFSGEITEISQTPSPPFHEVNFGDPWTLSYTFDPGAGDIDSTANAGNYPDVVNGMTLTIGEASVSGPPAAAASNWLNSVIGVNLGEGYADYNAQMGLPDPGDAWAQIILRDVEGTPFTSDALPLELPTPYDVVFPDEQSFYLRLPGSSEVFLKGRIGQASVVETGTHAKVRADFRIRVDDSGPSHLDLLWGVADEQAVSYGVFLCPGCEVMGFEPSPFRWIAFNATTGEQPTPGEAVLTIDLGTPGGDVMGVEPSPFRVFLDTDEEYFGELDFSEATLAFPGPLGGLSLEGVRVVLDDGSAFDLDGFDIYDATDKIHFGGTRIERFIKRFIDAPDVVGFVAGSDDADVGIVAEGLLSCPGCEVMGVEPSPFKWLATDGGLIPPADEEEVVTFTLDPVGEISGVEPSPFRVSLSADGVFLGELAFDAAVGNFPGAFGSLSLGEVSLTLPDGSSLGVEATDIYDVGDTVTFVGPRVDLRVTERLDADERQVDLVVNSTRYGVAGFGSGSITDPASEVMGVEPSPFRWVVDPLTGVPADDEAAVTYLSDLASSRMGVEPTPFRHLVVDSEDRVLGEVVFRGSEGVWGSFHLEGVDIRLMDRSTIEVQSFDTSYVLVVVIDVKPGSTTNTINLGSAGVIPVAILSSSSFDATMVNPETISLSGASVRLVGNGKRYLSQPEDVNGDGLDDLKCNILTDELELEIGDSVVVLEAETYDGTAITGWDFIRIVPD